MSVGLGDGCLSGTGLLGLAMMAWRPTLLAEQELAEH